MVVSLFTELITFRNLFFHLITIGPLPEFHIRLCCYHQELYFLFAFQFISAALVIIASILLRFPTINPATWSSFQNPLLPSFPVPQVKVQRFPVLFLPSLYKLSNSWLFTWNMPSLVTYPTQPQPAPCLVLSTHI